MDTVGADEMAVQPAYGARIVALCQPHSVAIAIADNALTAVIIVGTGGDAVAVVAAAAAAAAELHIICTR